MTEEEFLKKCIKIIKSSPSDDAKKEIASLKHPLKNEKIGIEGAEKIYYHYSKKYSIKYDKNTTPKDYINRINVYDMGGKPMQIINYSNTGIILNESFKAKDDSLSVIYQYYNQKF